MSFSIATHTDTRWTVGCYALTSLSIALLSMILHWVALGALVLLIWSTWKEKQGDVGWFRAWIPKQHTELKVDWLEDNHKNDGTNNGENGNSNNTIHPNLIHFYMDTRDHWWIKSAIILLGLTALCWICVLMSWVTLALSILPVLCIVGVLGHTSASDTTAPPSTLEGIQIHSPAETTWYGLQLFFEHHNTMLAKTGTLVVHCQPSNIPVRLPTGFEDWTIEHKSE